MSGANGAFTISPFLQSMSGGSNGASSLPLGNPVKSRGHWRDEVLDTTEGSGGQSTTPGDRTGVQSARPAIALHVPPGDNGVSSRRSLRLAGDNSASRRSLLDTTGSAEDDSDLIDTMLNESGSDFAASEEDAISPVGDYHSKACKLCSKRRYKCDRSLPICGRCQKKGDRCIYTNDGRVTRWMKSERDYGTVKVSTPTTLAELMSSLTFNEMLCNVRWCPLNLVPSQCSRHPAHTLAITNRWSTGLLSEKQPVLSEAIRFLIPLSLSLVDAEPAQVQCISLGIIQKFNYQPIFNRNTRVDKIPRMISIAIQGIPPGATIMIFIHGFDGLTCRRDIWRTILRIAEEAGLRLMIGVIESMTRIECDDDLITPLDTEVLKERLKEGWRWVPGIRSEGKWCALFELRDMIRDFELPDDQQVPLHRTIMHFWESLANSRHEISRVMNARGPFGIHRNNKVARKLRSSAAVGT